MTFKEWFNWVFRGRLPRKAVAIDWADPRVEINIHQGHRILWKGTLVEIQMSQSTLGIQALQQSHFLVSVQTDEDERGEVNDNTK